MFQGLNCFLAQKLQFVTSAYVPHRWLLFVKGSSNLETPQTGCHGKKSDRDPKMAFLVQVNVTESFNMASLLPFVLD